MNAVKRGGGIESYVISWVRIFIFLSEHCLLVVSCSEVVRQLVIVPAVEKHDDDGWIPVSAHYK